MDIYKKILIRFDKEAYDTLTLLAAQASIAAGRTVSKNTVINDLIKSKKEELKNDDKNSR